MKTFYLTLLSGILLICYTVTANASPAYPGLVTMKQPDGSTFSYYLKGDEKVHWMESEDGYSLLYDSARTVVYAISDQEGNMIPSSVAVKDVSLRSASDQAFLKGIAKKISYSPAQINTMRSIWNVVESSSNANSSRMRASVGEIRAICALVDFPDMRLVKTKAEFNNLMNQVGYSVNRDQGSVHDYYVENSYGKLNLVITVAGPYTLSKSWKYYGANDANGNDSILRILEFAKEAATLTFTDPNINPADYDNNNDGYIDAFHIIHAGYGEESGGLDSHYIWSHETTIQELTFRNNKKLDTYSCSPELLGNSGSDITHIGVICHEMGHVFGAPDFYDVDDSKSGGSFIGTGNWDLMGSGSWNGDDNRYKSIGSCPAHMNMYEKIQLGWVNPIVLTQPQAITGMKNSAENAVAYRYDTSTPGEYFVLENRQKIKFDQYVPGTGLLIYHVSLNITDIYYNTVNVGHPQKMYPVCASANTNPTGTVASYGNINSAGCPFPGSSKKTSFTDYTIPSATAWNGANTVKPITEIQEQSGVISFRFLMPDAEPVTNLQVTAKDQSVELKWNKPSEDVLSYNVYRNNLLIIKLMGKDNTTYTQYNVGAGSYSYCVTACYNNKESATACKEVSIGSSPIDNNALTVKNLTAQNVNGNKDIELDWQSPFVNAWTTFAEELWKYVSYKTDNNQFVSVVRFTTDDLQNFQGSKLTKVRFSIHNLKCKHTIQVWTKDPGLTTAPGNPIVSQVVSNPSSIDTTIDVTLNSPVSVEANKELWIGIKYELNPLDVAVAGTDKGPMVEDRNFYFIDNKWGLVSDKDDFNWFISGYLDFGSNALNVSPASDWLRSATATATNYIVYRDNKQIATTNKSSYVDPLPSFGHHIYCVSIAYDNGKESESVCVDAISSNNTDLVPVTNSDGEINVYPNPIKRGENLVIHCDANSGSTFSLYAISGQLIEEEQITGSVIEKRMNYEPGIYLLQIKNNSKTFIRKIIIK
jgi:M6 family metalloprotease-like protein